jgi:hypothetical protein
MKKFFNNIRKFKFSIIVFFIFMIMISVIVRNRCGSHIPKESCRIYSSAGFSIICPQNWIIEELSISDEINIDALYFKSKRKYFEILSVERYKIKPTIISTRPNPDDQWNEDDIIFCGEPAIKYHFFKPGVFFDESSQSGLYICFEKNGHWYKIGYRNKGFGSKIPSYVWEFLNTFRIEK